MSPNKLQILTNDSLLIFDSYTVYYIIYVDSRQQFPGTQNLVTLGLIH